MIPETLIPHPEHRFVLAATNGVRMAIICGDSPEEAETMALRMARLWNAGDDLTRLCQLVCELLEHTANGGVFSEEEAAMATTVSLLDALALTAEQAEGHLAHRSGRR